MMTAKEYIQALHMEPLVDEGGWFAPLWRSADDKTVSAIYYLLRRGEISRWHRLCLFDDKAETRRAQGLRLL